MSPFINCEKEEFIKSLNINEMVKDDWEYDSVGDDDWMGMFSLQ